MPFTESTNHTLTLDQSINIKIAIYHWVACMSAWTVFKFAFRQYVNVKNQRHSIGRFVPKNKLKWYKWPFLFLSLIIYMILLGLISGLYRTLKNLLIKIYIAVFGRRGPKPTLPPCMRKRIKAYSPFLSKSTTQDIPGKFPMAKIEEDNFSVESKIADIASNSIEAKKTSKIDTCPWRDQYNDPTIGSVASTSSKEFRSKQINLNNLEDLYTFKHIRSVPMDKKGKEPAEIPFIRMNKAYKDTLTIEEYLEELNSWPPKDQQLTVSSDLKVIPTNETAIQKKEVKTPLITSWPIFDYPCALIDSAFDCSTTIAAGVIRGGIIFPIKVTTYPARKILSTTSIAASKIWKSYKRNPMNMEYKSKNEIEIKPNVF